MVTRHHKRGETRFELSQFGRSIGNTRTTLITPNGNSRRWTYWGKKKGVVTVDTAKRTSLEDGVWQIEFSSHIDGHPLPVAIGRAVVDADGKFAVLGNRRSSGPIKLPSGLSKLEQNLFIEQRIFEFNRAQLFGTGGL